MIVVAIIGILAAIAIPAYQDYLIRSQVTEGMSMAAAAKASVSEYYANNGSWPLDNAPPGLGVATEIQGKYVSALTVGTGGITVDFGNEANAVRIAATARPDPGCERQWRRDLALRQGSDTPVGLGWLDDSHVRRYEYPARQVPAVELPLTCS